jgi:hypothetical protein
MDFNSSECTENQAFRVYMIITNMCDHKATNEKWKLDKILMKLSFDSEGPYYLVYLRLIDNSGKPIYAEIRRQGNYDYVENI